MLSAIGSSLRCFSRCKLEHAPVARHHLREEEPHPILAARRYIAAIATLAGYIFKNDQRPATRRLVSKNTSLPD